MTKLGAYARVYYDDLEEEFPTVVADDRQLATWLRLLIRAERMWPVAAPDIPRATPAKPLAALVAVGLVVLVGKDRYQVRGYAAERTRRGARASHAAASRWHSNGIAASNADGDA